MLNKNDVINMNYRIHFEMIDIHRSTTQKSNIEEEIPKNCAVSNLT